jgi:N-acetylmuramoyl-L-alanine amidase
VDELRPVTKLLHNTHRFAGFAVLKSPEVPSVLVEMGYLSNRADEHQLQTPKFRAAVAAAVVQGLDHYFASQQALKRP